MTSGISLLSSVGGYINKYWKMNYIIPFSYKKKKMVIRKQLINIKKNVVNVRFLRRCQ